ncbi:Aldehyde dehydrogenase family protein [Pseudomonas sp. NFIX28]|nr:Aldehyde dehydrogenase family protein [Pseudomonas sp. NFIX28]
MTNVSSLRPVASIITARDAPHALELTNDSEFGLASTIYTRNVELAQKLAGELETGGVFINGYCATNPCVTFAGVKKSGFSRELSHFGVREFCNAQIVWLDRH